MSPNYKLNKVHLWVYIRMEIWRRKYVARGGHLNKYSSREGRNIHVKSIFLLVSQYYRLCNFNTDSNSKRHRAKHWHFFVKTIILLLWQPMRFIFSLPIIMRTGLDYFFSTTNLYSVDPYNIYQYVYNLKPSRASNLIVSNEPNSIYESVCYIFIGV